MKRILRLRPSPALVVSFVALFVALGGSAYALTITNADIRNNSISGNKLSDNSVPATAKLRNRTITAIKVKPRSLRGRLFQQDSIGPNAVKEQVLDASKLGKVGEAVSADAVGGVEVRRVEPFTLPVGQSRGVATIAPFALTARCRAEGPNHVAEVVIQTNRNGSALDAADNVPAFHIGAVARLVGVEATPGTPAFAQGVPGVAIAPDGATVGTDALYAGLSVLGQPNVCRFGGHLRVG